jgi:hypothetical protein
MVYLVIIRLLLQRRRISDLFKQPLGDLSVLWNDFDHGYFLSAQRRSLATVIRPAHGEPASLL